VLWFAALFGWAAVVEGILVVAEVDLDGRSRQLLSTVLIAAGAVGLWIGLRHSLQLLAMFVSLFAVLSAAVVPVGEPGPFGESDFVLLSLVSWLFGAAWMALGARGVAQPARTSLVLGKIAVLFSPVFLTVGGQASESTLTVVEGWVLAGSVACLVVGAWLEERAVQGLAIVGVLVAVAALTGDLLGSSQGPAIAAVVIVDRTARRCGAGDPCLPVPDRTGVIPARALPAATAAVLVVCAGSGPDGIAVVGAKLIPTRSRFYIQGD
jgi:hypothetical protein